MNRIDRMSALISNFSGQFVHIFISTGLQSRKFYLNLQSIANNVDANVENNNFGQLLIINLKRKMKTKTTFYCLLTMLLLIVCSSARGQYVFDTDKDKVLPPGENYYTRGMSASWRNDWEYAIQMWTKAADMGHIESMLRLGYTYHEGIGVNKDCSMQLYWYERAAQNGSVEACRYIAEMYERGECIEKNLPLAIKWYEEAIDLGDTEYSPHHIEFLYDSNPGLKSMMAEKSRHNNDNTLEEQSESSAKPLQPTYCSSCSGGGKCTSCGGTGKYYANGRYHNCGVCGGSGVCSVCHGTGSQPELQTTPQIQQANWCVSCSGGRKCSSCGGKGSYYMSGKYHPCQICHGSGICQVCHGTGIQ
ncbi:MAG: SEL1-like repeat protein [Prevotella sp.]|nr:SEL1-like repeat protein [Prevotella sp.]MBQ3845804.1 SEL1-like repeat protein [Bacteroidales bacterium]